MFPTKVILKTCGTTTLLHGVDRLLAIAAECGLNHVAHVFYSRKNFLEPRRQVQPHGSFKQETRTLLERFPTGGAHIFGNLTGDHWCVFVAELPPPAVPATVATGKALLAPHTQPDHTLEVRLRALTAFPGGASGR